MILRFSNEWLRDKIASDPDVECEAGRYHPSGAMPDGTTFGDYVRQSEKDTPMSYSFSVTADNKTDATRQIREQFDAVVLAQPSHDADKEAAVVAAQSLVRVLVDPQEGEEIHVSMSGSLGWRWESDNEFTSAQVNINASLRNKTK